MGEKLTMQQRDLTTKQLALLKYLDSLSSDELLYFKEDRSDAQHLRHLGRKGLVTFSIDTKCWGLTPAGRAASRWK